MHDNDLFTVGKSVGLTKQMISSDDLAKVLFLLVQLMVTGYLKECLARLQDIAWTLDAHLSLVRIERFCPFSSWGTAAWMGVHLSIFKWNSIEHYGCHGLLDSTPWEIELHRKKACPEQIEINLSPR